MKHAALYGLFLALGIIIGMTIQSANAFTDTDFQTLQKQVNSLTSRLNLLQTAFVNDSAGTVTVKGTNVTIQSSGSIAIKASGPLSLKGTPVTQN
jgi:hypothetical protein